MLTQTPVSALTGGELAEYPWAWANSAVWAHLAALCLAPKLLGEAEIAHEAPPIVQFAFLEVLLPGLDNLGQRLLLLSRHDELGRRLCVHVSRGRKTKGSCPRRETRGPRCGRTSFGFLTPLPFVHSTVEDGIAGAFHSEEEGASTQTERPTGSRSFCILLPREASTRRDLRFWPGHSTTNGWAVGCGLFRYLEIAS